MERDVYFGRVKLHGEEDEETLIAALNYSSSLVELRRFEKVKSLLRRTTPVAQRVLGANHDHTLRMRSIYARTLYINGGATLDELREAVTTFEDVGRIARRVLGGAHPLTGVIKGELLKARSKLRASEESRSVPRQE